MVRGRRFWALALLVAAVLGLWLFYPTRERQVRRQLRALASWATKEGPEGQLATAMRARDAERFVAPASTWSTEGQELSGTLTPSEIGRFVFAYRSHWSQISVKFYDLQVDFPEDAVADVTATVLLRGRSDAGDDLNETHEVNCRLEKGDGGWLIHKVTVVEVLKR